ncbi:MAG: ComEA family DNA-binding protein [Lachnospiraceae bacterium]|nr:ComEA family DNA-binding protein [Lachnospiraceae bacterium]
MKYLHAKWMKLVLTALFMILAGICYSCSRQTGEELFFSRGKTGVIALSESSAGNEKEESGKEGGQSAEDGFGQEGDQDFGENRISGQNADEDLFSEIQDPNGSEASGKSQGSGEGLDDSRSSRESASADTCFVHICGAVARPGVYELAGESRIYQAVEAAGGLLPEAEERLLNLAAPIVDGMKITVFTKEEARSVSEADVISLPASSLQPGLAGTGSTGSENGTRQININTAGKDELMTLKGIGASRAEDIIAYREKHGFFQKIEDIMKVPGIKDGAFQKIKDDITV